MRRLLHNYASLAIAGLMAAAILSGCSPIDAFKPEVIRIDQGEITIKGWIDEKKAVFCVKIELRKHPETVTLHSLNVVSPDGARIQPHNWKDQTPRNAPPRVSVGFGIPIGGRGGDGHYSEGYHHGRRPGGVLTPGVSFPLQKENSGRSVTRVTACWRLDTIKDKDPSKYSLEVNLSQTSVDKISLITLTLAMAHHQEEEKTETAPPPDKKEDDKKDDQQTAKDLISEIDFTQKGPVKTKSLDV